MVRELRRVGKRIAFGFENDLWLVLHLMIAGRLHWRPVGAKLGGRQNLAAFDFPNGSLVLTEAGSKRRASLQLFAGEEALGSVDPGGIDIFAGSLDEFRAVLTSENRTLKRALTDPRFLSGIGNAYSDEILHAAKLSPITLTHKLNDENGGGYLQATRETMRLWIDRLRAEAEKDFPEKSRLSARTWRCMAASASRVRGAARRFSAFGTRTTRRTIACVARPAGKCWPTAASRD